MTTDSDTEKAFNWAKELADKIFKVQERLNKSFETELSKDILQAIEDNDDVILKLKLQALQNVIHGMEANLEDTLRAVDWLETINKDDDFSTAHQDEIQNMTTIVANARTRLTHQIQAAKKLEGMAKKGLDSAAASKEAVERDFDEIELRINDEKKYLPAVRQKAEDANDRAQQAVEAHDGKALADAQKAINDLAIDALVMYHETQEFETRMGAFLKKIQDRGLDEDLLTQFRDGTKKLLATNAENAVDLKHLQKLSKSVADAKIGEYDVKKVLKTLHIDPKIQSRVEPAFAKVLKGPGKDLEKSLDSVARQFKLPTAGKQMAAELKKAGDAVYK